MYKLPLSYYTPHYKIFFQCTVEQQQIKETLHKPIHVFRKAQHISHDSLGGGFFS